MDVISATYSNLNNTAFPDGIDRWPKFTEPGPEELPVIREYQEKYSTGDLVGASLILQRNEQLKAMIINAASLNQICDAVTAIEQYYKDQYDVYIRNLTRQIQVGPQQPANQDDDCLWFELTE